MMLVVRSTQRTTTVQEGKTVLEKPVEIANWTALDVSENIIFEKNEEGEELRIGLQEMGDWDGDWWGCFGSIDHRAIIKACAAQECDRLSTDRTFEEAEWNDPYPFEGAPERYPERY